MTRRSVEIPENLGDRAEKCAEFRGYTNVSEFIRDAIRRRTEDIMADIEFQEMLEENGNIPEFKKASQL